MPSYKSCKGRKSDLAADLDGLGLSNQNVTTFDPVAAVYPGAGSCAPWRHRPAIHGVFARLWHH